MRISHKWEERPSVSIKCPYCGVWETYEPNFFVGDLIRCRRCDKTFELGKQKQCK